MTRRDDFLRAAERCDSAAEREWIDADIATLLREAAGMMEALSFYGNEMNWQSPSTGFALQYDREPSPVEKDRGVLARAVQSAKEAE